MKTKNFDPKLLNRFLNKIEKKGHNIDSVLRHFCGSINLQVALKATNFKRVLQSDKAAVHEILYKDGDRITGNEEVIRVEKYEGAILHFISELCFWISARGLKLLQDNLEAINAFSTKGYREDGVLKEWPKAKTLSKRIYFVKRDSATSCEGLENIYETVGPRITLNVQAAFNVKYPKLHKKFTNGIQRKDSKGNFCCGIFDHWIGGAEVSVSRRARGWGSVYWFPLGKF